MRGFTLMELMIVIGLMAIVMATGVPIAYKAIRREPLNQAVRDVVEVLSNARAQAILQGRMTELIIHPRDRRMEIGAGRPVTVKPEEGFGDFDPPREPAPSESGLSAVISHKVVIEMLDVNLIEYKDSEYARVRFYPNGTCDEFTLILRSDKGEWIKVWLEITTSLANVGPVDR